MRPFVTILLACLAWTASSASAATITGRFTIPSDIAALPDYTFTPARLVTVVQRPEITYPDEYITWTPAQRHAWYLDYLKTDPGKVYKSALDKADADTHIFIIPINHDGTFRADLIPTGAYTLAAHILKRPDSAATDAIATGSTSVKIPPSPADGALDLGAILMTAAQVIGVGDIAPDFSVKTLDGKDLRLSDFKGKYILLDFWATWCGPCMAEIPIMKEIHNTFGTDPRFAMISLSLDAAPARPLHVVEKNDLHWTQGFLGEWSTTKLPETYGVRGIPATFLIGPDGKVIAKDLLGDAIKSAVTTSLQK